MKVVLGHLPIDYYKPRIRSAYRLLRRRNLLPRARLVSVGVADVLVALARVEELVAVRDRGVFAVLKLKDYPVLLRSIRDFRHIEAVSQPALELSSV